MMPQDPLRSAMAAGNSEDTSLALPNDNRLRSGQQRVLDQVHTIKRSKSKTSRNGSLSPTGSAPQKTTFAEFGSFKFSPSKANGLFSRASSSTTFNKSMGAQKSRTLSSRTFGGRLNSASANWEQQVNISSWPQGSNGLKPSRSDPTLAPPFAVAQSSGMQAKGQMMQSQSITQTKGTRQSSHSINNGTMMTTSQTRTVQPPSQFQEGKMGTIKVSTIEQKSAVNTLESGGSDLTLKEAVEYLSHSEEQYQQRGATFIQHTTYNDERTKSEVLQLGGIPGLVTLLRSPNPGVSQAAAGALRNLVFKDQNNKLEVQHCGGIGKALQLLKETDSTETQKQITGLLWNLSSSDELKKELIDTALPALTENVVTPFTSWSDNVVNNHIDPQVYYCATGCLRNLSCGTEAERNKMRNCAQLIDSLMSYIQSCVAEENPDDESVENCACILHNLSYQLEQECPESYSDFNPQRDAQVGNKKDSTVGCFSPKSSKAQKEFVFDMAHGMPKSSNASGVKWLCHPKAMETYLSLLGTSQKDATLEACCGALRNLTASKEVGSRAVSHMLVQKFKAPLQTASLLKSQNPTLQTTAIALLGNMSRNTGLQRIMAKQILPELTSLLLSGSKHLNDLTLVTACNTARRLMLSDTEISKKLISHDLVFSLEELSENKSFPEAQKSVSILLYSLWNEKNLQGVIKKLGMSKSIFVNDTTTAAHQAGLLP